MEISMSLRNKKLIKKNKKTTTTTFPDDIIVEILSWVPAKSLLRLRWAYYDYTRKNKDNIYSDEDSEDEEEFYRPCKIFQCYIDYSTTTTTTTTTTGSFTCSGPTNPILSGIFDEFLILGSCHGLILFSYYLREGKETKLCLWNPCTKEYKYLPHPNNLFGYNCIGCLANFGLGYDHSIQDYKVIYNVNTLDAATNHVQVYTLRTNSWRDIGSFAINVPSRFFGHGVFVNGALYFIHRGDNYFMGPGTRVFSFNFEKEMYGEISNQPECLKNHKDNKARILVGLAMFEGSLCLTYRTQNDCQKSDRYGRIENTIETWVMKKDYNMNNNNNEEYSWSKLYEIPHHVGLLRDFLQPLRFIKEGEILLLDHNDGLLSFDPKNNKVTINNEDYKQATAHDTQRIEAIYTESLVSLNSGTYIDDAYEW